MDKAFVSIVKTEIGFFLLVSKVDDQWSVMGFKTEREGLGYYEIGYARSHNRSYESSMSACLNWMAYQPSIIELELEIMKALTKDQHVYHLRHVAGYMDGIKLTEEAAKYWEAGKKPELINNEMLTK